MAEDIFSEAMQPERFFGEVLYELHRERGWDDEFDMISAGPLTLWCVVRTQGFGTKTWSVTFKVEEVEVVEGEFGEPVAVVHVDREVFVALTPHLNAFVDRLEDYVERQGLYVAEEHVPMLRNLGGRVVLEVEGEGGAQLGAEVWFCACGTKPLCTPPRRSFTLKVSRADFERLESGAIDVVHAIGEGLIAVEGDMALALKVGAAIGRMK